MACSRTSLIYRITTSSGFSSAWTSFFASDSVKLRESSFIAPLGVERSMMAWWICWSSDDISFIGVGLAIMGSIVKELTSEGSQRMWQNCGGTCYKKLRWARQLICKPGPPPLLHPKVAKFCHLIQGTRKAQPSMQHRIHCHPFTSEKI